MVGAILTWLALILGAGALSGVRVRPRFCWGLTALAVPLIGIALTALQRKRVRAARKAGGCANGQTVNIVWRAKNNSPLPVLQLRLRVLLENKLTGEQTRRTIRLQAARTHPPRRRRRFPAGTAEASVSARACGAV